MVIIVKQKHNGDVQSLDLLNEVLHINNTATLIDGSMLPEMAKINIVDKHIDAVKSDLQSGWFLFPEKKYKIPDSKKKLSDGI